MDRLQYLTMEGYAYAISLPSFSATRLKDIQARHLPQDFLFLVPYEAVRLLPSHISDSFDSMLLQSRDIDKNFPFPNTTSLQNIVFTIRNHVFCLPALRTAESVNLLIIGCEQPILILILFKQLCDALQDRAQHIKIEVIDKNSDICARGNSLINKFNLADSIEFKNVNFMLFGNNEVEKFDVVLSLISSPSVIFAVKYSLLVFGSNIRQYKRNCKLFLASQGLFELLDEVSEQKLITYTLRFRMRHVNSANDDKKGKKDICQLQQVQGGTGVYKFGYHPDTAGDRHAASDIISIQLLFVDILTESVQCITKLAFQNLFSKNFGKFFGDVNSETNLCVDSFKYSSILMQFSDCIGTVNLKQIASLQEYNLTLIWLEVNEATNNNGQWLQGGKINISVNTTTKEKLNEYLTDNLTNALRIAKALEIVQKQIIKIILNSSGVLEDVKIEDCLNVLSFFQNFQLHKEFKDFITVFEDLKLELLNEETAFDCSKIFRWITDDTDVALPHTDDITSNQRRTRSSMSLKVQTVSTSESQSNKRSKQINRKRHGGKIVKLNCDPVASFTSSQDGAFYDGVFSQDVDLQLLRKCSDDLYRDRGDFKE
jgi:hypothetical protein